MLGQLGVQVPAAGLVALHAPEAVDGVGRAGVVSLLALLTAIADGGALALEIVLADEALH